MDESESPSWKGHGFTLLVFGGIVLLCSIFFVLGMLVGRNQGQRIAEAAAGDTVRKPVAQPLPEAQPLKFFDSTTKSEPDDELQPRPAPPAAVDADVPASAPPPEPDPPPVKETVNKAFLQIFATQDRKEAEKEQDKVQSKGFRTVILPPKPEDEKKWYRVQVGPYDSKAEAAAAKQELLAQGYKEVILK